MKKFHLAADKSPTHANLAHFLTAQGWAPTQHAAQASFNESWLEFPKQISETLEYKHLLAAFLQEHQLAHLMPETFFINDEIWPQVLAVLKEKMPDNTCWILKPSMLNNGQHIHLFPDLHAVTAHFLSSQRMGGPQVLQRYIVKPQLIKGPDFGHKFSIRQLLVLSTHAESVLFPSGYLNIALKPYQEHNFCELASHLTNEHLGTERINVVQRLSDEIAIFQPYKERITSICKLIISAVKKQFAPFWQEREPRVACFGIDFIIEKCGDKLWLLEANHGPCFPINNAHPLFNSLYTPFWQEFIKQFIARETSDFIILP